MATKTTTEDLRHTLFDCINQIKSGCMEPEDGKVIAALSNQIVQTAKLELEYAETVSKLDADKQGVTPGPLLLASTQIPD